MTSFGDSYENYLGLCPLRPRVQDTFSKAYIVKELTFLGKMYIAKNQQEKRKCGCLPSSRHSIENCVKAGCF